MANSATRHFRHLSRPWIGALALGGLLLGLVAVVALGPPANAPYSPQSIGNGQFVLAGVPFGGSAWNYAARNGTPIVDVENNEGGDAWGTLRIQDPSSSVGMLALPHVLSPISSSALALSLVLLGAAILLRLLVPGFGWTLLVGSVVVSSFALVGRYPEPLSALCWLVPLPVGGLALLETRPRRRTLIAVFLGVVGLAMVLIVFFAEQPGGDAPHILLLGPLVVGAFGLVAALGAGLRDAVVRARQGSEGPLTLMMVVNELVPGRAVARLTTIERERGRLALEIHDEVLPSLAAVTQRLDAVSPSEAADLRRVAATLRSQMSDRRLVILEALGIEAALRELVARLEREVRLNAARITLEVERGDEGQRRPPEPVELAAYRIAQQALVNALEHAVGATQIAVRLDMLTGGRGLALLVRDDGQGLHPDELERALRQGHLGFAEMRARAASAGGSLEIGPARAKMGAGPKVGMIDGTKMSDGDEMTTKDGPPGTEVRFQWVA